MPDAYGEFQIHHNSKNFLNRFLKSFASLKNTYALIQGAALLAHPLPNTTINAAGTA